MVFIEVFMCSISFFENGVIPLDFLKCLCYTHFMVWERLVVRGMGGEIRKMGEIRSPIFPGSGYKYMHKCE
jgi:hypothetical protein